MAKTTYDICVLPGDGIGTEVTAAALPLLEQLAQGAGFAFTFAEHRAGALHYKATGDALPDATLAAAERADAILFGAMGWPEIRYPDGTEIAPQLDLRVRLELYAGVRPARAIPGIPLPLADSRATGIDLVLVRESTEGLFASRGRGVVEDDREARDTMVITRAGSERVHEFAFRLAERRRAFSCRWRSSAGSSMKSPPVIPRSPRAIAMSTRPRSIWCASRGTSTCSSPRTCSATSCPINARR